MEHSWANCREYLREVGQRVSFQWQIEGFQFLFKVVFTRDDFKRLPECENKVVQIVPGNGFEQGFDDFLSFGEIDDYSRIGNVIGKYPFIILQGRLIKSHRFRIFRCCKERILLPEHLDMSLEITFPFPVT